MRFLGGKADCNAAIGSGQAGLRDKRKLANTFKGIINGMITCHKLSFKKKRKCWNRNR